MTLGKPRAILAISAHRFISSTVVNSMERPKGIHDFYGFLQELFDFDNPAHGLLGPARPVVKITKPDLVAFDD